MTKITVLLFLLLIASTSRVSAFQATYAISGVIKDQKGETLPGANILLSGYQKGAVADNQGKFMINGLDPGNYDVLVQMIGYLPGNVNVIINDKSVTVDIVMTENIRQLKEVVIRADPNREHYLQLFKASFIGTSPNAEKCELKNPDVIWFDYAPETGALKATADEFILIENKALGYRIKYLLKYFEENEGMGLVIYYGYPSFEDMATSNAKKRRYRTKRNEAYFGSPQHFFSALFNDAAQVNGFIINKMQSKPNPKKLPDSVLDAKIKQFSYPTGRGASLVKGSGDSLRYYQQNKRLPDSVDILSRAEVQTDTLVKKEVSNLRWINFTDQLYVVYTREKESRAYSEQSGYKVKRPLDLASSQVSIVHQMKTPIAFYQNGLVFDPSSLLYEGYWGYEKVADMVPVDYVPGQ